MIKELIECPVSLAQLKTPDIKSLKFALLDPFDHKMSLYGVDITSSFVKAISECVQDLLDRFLKDLCQKEAEILKRQIGDAYGFGSNPDSSKFLKLQISDKDLQKAYKNCWIT